MQRSANQLALALCILLLAPTLLPAQTGDVRRPKKIIQSGQDQPDTRTLRENLATLERWPFDGVVINAIGRSADGKPRDLRGAFIDELWQRDWYQNCIDDLKACHFSRPVDNFFVLGANPGNVDWFDDAGWKNIVDHWRIAAWLAKQAGVKGLLFDPEPYQPPFAQYRYLAQPQADRHSFAKYCEKARQRGREVMQAVAAEYPEVTIYCYFMESINIPAVGDADPRTALEQRSYGLYTPFLDGWLDVVPPTVTLVDGCENAYLYNSQRQFLEANTRIKGDCQELVSPENRAKYRAQVQTSFGFYLDAYWNPKDSEWGSWYIDGLGGSRVARLQANMASGLGTADEYVWLWGEKFRWWPTSAGSMPTKMWPEVLPGCDEMLRLARDPQGVGRQRIAAARQAGTLKSLLLNGDFAAETVPLAEGGEAKYEGDAPAAWDYWPQADKIGIFAWDRSQGTARLANVRDGGLRQAVAVEPEQFYAVRGRCRQQGHGAAIIRIRWQNAAEEWLDKDQDCVLAPVESVDAWKEAFRVLQVPEQAAQMVVVPSVHGQQSAEDVAWFDDVEVYRVP